MNFFHMALPKTPLICISTFLTYLWSPCCLEDKTVHSVYISGLPAVWKTKLSLQSISLVSLLAGRQNCPFCLHLWSPCWLEDRGTYDLLYNHLKYNKLAIDEQLPMPLPDIARFMLNPC